MVFFNLPSVLISVGICTAVDFPIGDRAARFFSNMCRKVNVHGGLEQIPLGADGRARGDFKVKAGDCLPCMEGADEEHKCCNTCQEPTQLAGRKRAGG